MPERKSPSNVGIIDRIRTAQTMSELELLKAISDKHTSASSRTKRTTLAEYEARKKELNRIHKQTQ